MRPFGSVCFFLHGRGFNGDSDRCWLCPAAYDAAAACTFRCCSPTQPVLRWTGAKAMATGPGGAREGGFVLPPPAHTSLARSPFARRGYRCRAARHTGVRACMHGTGRSVASLAGTGTQQAWSRSRQALRVSAGAGGWRLDGARRPFVRPGEQETVAVLRVCGGTRSTTPGRSRRITDKFCPSLQHPVPVVSTVHCRRTQPHHRRKFSPTIPQEF